MFNKIFMGIPNKLTRTEAPETPSLFAVAAADTRTEIAFSFEKDGETYEIPTDNDHRNPTDEELLQFLGMNNFKKLLEKSGYFDNSGDTEKKDFVAKNMTKPLLDYINEDKIALGLHFKAAIYLKSMEDEIEMVCNELNNELEGEDIDKWEDPKVKELLERIDRYEKQYSAHDDKNERVNMKIEEILRDILLKYENAKKEKKVNLRFIRGDNFISE